jgi:hypothetical protein
LVGYQILNEESRFKFEAAFLFYKIFRAFPLWVRQSLLAFLAVKNRKKVLKQVALSLTQIQLLQ